MCFFLKLFNSCSSSSKSKSSKRSSSTSSSATTTTTTTTTAKSLKPNQKSKKKLLLPVKNSILSLSTSAINQTQKEEEDRILDPIKTPSKNSQLASANKLNEKTNLKLKQLDFKLANSNSIEKAEKLKEKFFNTKFVYNKLSDNKLNLVSHGENNLVFKNLTLTLNEEDTKKENLKFKNQIIDYCNYCGYYCCECDNTLVKTVNNPEAFNNNINHVSIGSPLLSKDILFQFNSVRLTKTNKKKKSDKNNIQRFFTNSAYFIKEMNSNNDNSKNSSKINNTSSSSSSSLTDESVSSSNNTFKFSTNSIENHHLISANYSEQLDDNIPLENKKSNDMISSGEDNSTFQFQSPKLKMRPALGTSGILNRNQKLQNELKLDQLAPKLKTYVFNPDNSFSNELLREANELSDILENEISNSKQDLSQEETSILNRNHANLNNNLVRYHQNHRHRSDVQRGGKITISSDKVYEFKEGDLKDLGPIGNGEFGTVLKVLHVPSGTMMALKRIGPTVGNQRERKKVLNELDFVLECNDYENVVKFYGVKFNNEPADCLICMELMDTSLEKFYKFVYDVKHEEIPEAILGKIVVATVNALNYLKEKHRIIHRDVKPSNILVNRQGEIKICDFGISGKLVDSIAASRDAGCQLYMAPERIDPSRYSESGYDVRSDVWSLGITLYELATGKFPYPQWKTIFHQLNLVVVGDAPRLEDERLSQDFLDFVNTCLTKDDKKRPKYKQLLEMPLIKIHQQSDVSVSDYVTPYINQMQSNSKFK